MAKIVNVPGVGNYAVPDNATQQQIDNFIRNVSANGGLKAPSAPPPEEATGQGGIPLVSPLLSGAATGIAEIPLSIYGLFDKEGSQGARKATYDVIQRGLGMNPEAQPTTTESVLGGIGSLVPMLGASVLTEGAATPLLASRLGLGGARALTAAEEAAAAAKLASQATIARTAGGAAAAIPLGMGQGQQMVQQYEEQTGNKLTTGQYTAANLLSGAVGAFDLAPLERWAAPVAKLLEKVPASESIAASKIVNNEKSKFLMEVAKGAGMEGGQEAVSQIAQNLVAAGIYNPDQDITESVAGNFGLGAGVGGMVEAAVLGATGIKNRRMAARNAQLLGDANNTRTTARAAIEQGKNVPNASDIAGLTPAPSPISRPLGDIATDIKNTNAELDQARQNLQFFQATSPNTKKAIKGQTIDLSTLTEPEVRDLARRLKVKPSQDADLRTAITEKTNPERITQELLRQKVDTLQARSNSLQRSFDIGASTGSSAPRENITGSRFRVAPAPIATHELSPVAKGAVYGNVTEAPADDVRSVADAERAVRAALSKKEIAGPRPDTTQMSDQEIAALINAAKIKVQKNEDPRMAVEAATDNVIKRGILKQELDAIRQKAKEQDRFAVVEDQFDSEGNKIGEAVVNRHRDEAAANESAQLFNEAADPLKYQARVAPIGRALRNVLTGMNLPDVGIQLQQRIGNPGEYIEGQYDPAGNLIQIATGLYKPGMTEAQLEAKIVSVMHHEIIHSLKEMGVFKPHEWNRLLKAIGSQKMHGKLYTPLDWVTQLRTDLVEKAMNGDESAAEELHEEAVAEMFRDWMANGRTPTPVGGLLSRILNVIKRIVGVSRTHKAEGIFRAIASGKIGARERVARGAPQAAPEAPSAPSAPTTAAPVETAPSAAPVAPEEPVIKGMRFAPRPSETGARMAPAPSPVDLRLPPSERVSQAAGIAEAARPVWERSVSGPMAPEIAPAIQTVPDIWRDVKFSKIEINPNNDKPIGPTYALLKEEYIPTNTRRVFKLMKVGSTRPGLLFPLYARMEEGGANMGYIPGHWSPAERQKVQIGGKRLAPRPGIHALNLPVFDQGKARASGEKRIWVEAEIPVQTPETQRESDALPSGIRDRIIGPNESYDFKTNTNASGDAGGWPIAGSAKLIRAIPDSEIAQILKRNGLEHQIENQKTGVSDEEIAKINAQMDAVAKAQDSSDAKFSKITLQAQNTSRREEIISKAKGVVDSFYNDFPRHPFMDNTLAFRVDDSDGFVALELEPDTYKEFGKNSEGVVHVKWIQAYPMRSGLGRKGMELIQDRARKAGVAITLEPFEKAVVGLAGLNKFYKKMGFKPRVAGDNRHLIWRPEEQTEGGAQKFSKIAIPAQLTGESEQEFSRWWKNSKTVNEDGSPKVFYHGRPTPLPNGQFEHSVSGALPGEEGPYYFSPMTWFANEYAEYDTSGDGFHKPSKAGSMYPVFLSAQNPWDYKNPRHVKDVVEYIAKGLESGKIGLDDLKISNPNFSSEFSLKDIGGSLKSGDWDAIEVPAVQKAIRELGFDGFYLVEDDVRNIAVFKPEQIKSIFNQFEPGTAGSKKLSKVNINKLDPADYMPRDFLPISTINLLHRAQGPGLSERFKGGYRNKLEAGRYIQSLYEAMREEVRKRGGNLPTDMTAQNDENADLISDVLTGEAVAALQKADNAIGWYDAKLKAAKRVMALIHPEILTNPEMEAAFDAAIAITSNGMAVVDNFREGLRQYEYYKKHKRFQEVGTGDQGSAMATHFARLNYILKELGVKDANRFLVTEYTVGELRRMGWPISGENVDTKVYGSFIFGPKIGQGFYQNLRGNYNPLTMDRWFMRMWNRITGNPFKTPKSEERMLENRLNIKREILNDKEISNVDRKIIDEAGKLFFGKSKFKGLVKALNPNTDAGAEKLDNFVKAIERRYQSYYTKFNKEKTDKALKPEKSDLMKAIGTHVDNVNGELQEDPRNGTEREYIRQVVSRAIDKLGRLGIKINTADFQALVWYPEKQLWRERFGVKPGRGEDNDYADAAKIVAKEKGISDAKIQNALSAGNRKGVGAAVNAGRGVPGSSAKPQESLRKGFTGKQKEQLTEELKKRKLFSAVDVGVPLSPELQEAFNNSFAPRVQKSFFESLTDLFTGDSLLRMTTNIFDKDAINLFTEERLNGQRLTGAYSATVAVHMARRAGTVGAAAIFNGVAPVQFKEKGNILSAYVRSANPGENKDAIAKFMAPIYKNGLQKQFALYGIAKRAKSKPGMKIVNMDEAQIDAAIRLGNQHPEVKEAFEAYQRHNRNLINMVVESGRIAPEEADAMLEDLNYYGAYRVYKDEAYTPKTGGSIGSGSKIEKLSGMSDEKILDDPIEIMIRNQMFWINAAMKNIAAIKSANLAVTAQEAKLVKGDVPAGAYTMVAYENGKKKTYMFEGPRAAIWYTSLRATDKIDWSGAMKYLGLPARVLRASVTHDPGFILANLFRDAFSTWGLRGEKVAPWETFFSFAESLKGSTALDAMRAFGIGGGYDEAMKDPETQAKMVAGKLSPGVHMTSNPFSLVKGLMGRLESLSEASDAATRLAVFKKVMEETGDEAEAAYRALEIMNFSKQGASSVVQIISQLVPFFNAGLQGKYVLSKGLYALGKGVSRGGFETLTPEERRLGVGVLYRGAMMSALALALEQLCGGDDQYEDRVAPYQRETSFIIPLKYFGMPGTFVSIPKPFEFGTMFATIPVAFYRYATNPNESGADLTRTMTTQMSTNFGINVIPPIFVPFIEQYFNTDLYTGQPLVGRGKQSLDPSLQYNSSTGEFSKMLGNKKVFYNVESGEWEGIPPIFVQNYIQSFGGPLGSYLLLAADAATAGSGVETLKASTPITKYPVIRRFLIDAKEQNPVGADTLYKMIGKIDEVNRTLAYYKKIGDIEGYKEYVQEKMPLIKNKGAIKALADVQKELRDRDTAINESKKLTPDEKRDELRKVNDIEAKYLNEIRRLKMELGM